MDPQRPQLRIRTPPVDEDDSDGDMYVFKEDPDTDDVVRYIIIGIIMILVNMFLLTVCTILLDSFKGRL
jgi:hypothetical protein